MKERGDPVVDAYIKARISTPVKRPESESKENHGVWDPMPEITIISPYVHSRVDSNTLTMGNPMPESTLTPMPESPMPKSFDFASGIDIQPGGIDSLDSIPGLLKRLQIRSLKRFKGVVKVETKSPSSILRRCETSPILGEIHN
jgi:hypothetical protein